MNILHLDEQRGWRGGEQQASWLLQGQAAQGHRVWIAGRAGSRFLTNDHGGAHCVRVPFALRGELDLWSAWKIAQLVRNEQIDILHAHTSHAHTMAVLARRWAGRGKVIVHRRVSFPPRQDFLNRWKYAQPDRFVCVSGKVETVMRAQGIPAEQLAMVYSAVDLARLDVPAASRADLGIADDAPLLFSAGALVGHKDHATLLRTVARLTASFPRLRVLIAGEGDLRSQLEDEIARLNLENSVTLLGHREDVPSLVRAADVYVSSSWSEGLGTSVLEALAAGTPVVAAEAGGIPEMVRNGETGWLRPNRDPEALAEAITECLQQPEVTARYAIAGRALVEEKFTADAMVAGNLKVYEDVLGTCS